MGKSNNLQARSPRRDCFLTCPNRGDDAAAAVLILSRKERNIGAFSIKRPDALQLLRGFQRDRQGLGVGDLNNIALLQFMQVMLQVR